MTWLNIPEKATGHEKCSWKHSHLGGYLRWTGYLLTGLSGRFVFRIIIIFIFGGSTSGLYADWLARRQQSRSLLVDEEQNEMCAFLAQLGSMDCLLGRLYQLQTHMLAAVDPH